MEKTKLSEGDNRVGDVRVEEKVDKLGHFSLVLKKMTKEMRRVQAHHLYETRTDKQSESFLPKHISLKLVSNHPTLPKQGQGSRGDTT